MHTFKSISCSSSSALDPAKGMSHTTGPGGGTEGFQTLFASSVCAYVTLDVTSARHCHMCDPILAAECCRELRSTVTHREKCGRGGERKTPWACCWHPAMTSGPGWCSESTQCHHSKDKVISLRSNHTDPLKMDATWLKCTFNLDSFLFLTKT